MSSVYNYMHLACSHERGRLGKPEIVTNASLISEARTGNGPWTFYPELAIE